jgi:hypothetical protein
VVLDDIHSLGTRQGCVRQLCEDWFLSIRMVMPDCTAEMVEEAHARLAPR